MSVHRHKVNSRRNSECAVELRILDWTRWFTDGTDGRLYLHVYHYRDEGIMRVWCRHSEKPRLAMHRGELHWLIDR
jgi:hypothetical protein